jgi:ABC-2 type transport system permease protein
MNTELNTPVESESTAAAVASAPFPASRQLYWSVRRELWENRSIYLAPLIAAAVLVFGHFIATIGRALAMPDLDQRQALLVEPSNFPPLVIMGVATLVAVIYCVDALYGERRDRSILFWKSMPVSDSITVLAKAAIPIFIIPVLSSVIAVVTQTINLLLSSLALRASGLDVSDLWAKPSFIDASVALLYHFVAIHGLWYAPVYGWLLLASAWARRAPFLWAVLPPVLIVAAEKIVFDTSLFGALLSHRFSGGAEGAKFSTDAGVVHPIEHLSPLGFMVSPGLWLGLAAAGLFLYAAACLRREREPI